MNESKNKINRIVIVDDEPIIRMGMKEILISRDYEVVGEASDGFDALEICRETKPDVVLMDVKMPLLDGLSAAKILLEEGTVETIILLTAYSDTEFIENAKEIGISGYLVKPIDGSGVIPAIEVVIAYGHKMKELKKEKESLEEQLDSRKKIERAKGLIMKQKNCSEEEAFNFIREISKSKNIAMKKVAETILITYVKKK